jgi:hypothetical protein
LVRVRLTGFFNPGSGRACVVFLLFTSRVYIIIYVLVL